MAREESPANVLFLRRREAAKTPLNRAASRLLELAGEIPQPLLNQPFLQLMFWGLDQPEIAGQALGEARGAQFDTREQLERLNCLLGQARVEAAFLYEIPDLTEILQEQTPEEAAQNLLKMLRAVAG